MLEALRELVRVVFKASICRASLEFCTCSYFVF